MKLTIETKVLQAMVNVALRGASHDKTDVMTNLFDIYYNDGRISITTTDSANYLTVYGNAEADEKMQFCVLLDKFSKLVSKTSTEKIKLELKDDHLLFVGNGSYKIPFMLDVDGSMVRMPIHKISDVSSTGEIETSVIRDIVMHNKPSLSVNKDDAKMYLTGYLCVKDCVMSSDEINLCQNNVTTIMDKAIIPANVFDILSTSKSDKITYNLGDNEVEFICSDMKLYCSFINGIEKYPEAVCRRIMDDPMPSKCTVSRTLILNTLNRIALFIDAKQRNVVRLTFTKDGIALATIDNDAVETIEYQGSENFNDFTCLADVDHLRSILLSYDVESIDIEYGVEQVLRISNDLTKHATALRRERKK